MRRSTILLAGLIGTSCGPIAGHRNPEPQAPIARPAQPSSARADDVSQGAGINGDGKGLYDKYCAACHAAIEQSAVARATVESMQQAITTVPEMQSLPTLNDEQLRLIAAALSKIPPGRSKANR